MKPRFVLDVFVFILTTMIALSSQGTDSIPAVLSSLTNWIHVTPNAYGVDSNPPTITWTNWVEMVPSSQDSNTSIGPPRGTNWFLYITTNSGGSNTIVISPLFTNWFVVGSSSGGMNTHHSHGANTNGWDPDTSVLDPYGPSDTNGASLEHDVRRFYNLLRDKQWSAAYDMRAKVYRETCPKAAYLRMAEAEGKYWRLANYDVLSAEMDEDEDSGSYTAVLICKFVELPGDAVSYSTVYWHKEDGSWKCLSAGPTKLDIFRGPITPTVDWK